MLRVFRSLVIILRVIGINKNLSLLQNVAIIFFSAAKATNERKISETSEASTPQNDELNSETDSAISDNEHESEDDVNVKEALLCTQEDIELFKQQLGDLDKAVCNTADKFDRIQEVLDKVVENLRLGKPIEDYPSTESTEKKVTTESEVNENKFLNSHEIYDREKLLEVLKKHHVGTLKNPPRLSVGMIGYPNVGKSSTVNVLMQTKKVSEYIIIISTFLLDEN